MEWGHVIRMKAKALRAGSATSDGRATAFWFDSDLPAPQSASPNGLPKVASAVWWRQFLNLYFHKTRTGRRYSRMLIGNPASGTSIFRMISR